MDVLVTYICLAFLLQAIFVMDDFYLERKVRTGAIVAELIKPMNFKLYVFSYFTGALFFKILAQLIPSLAVALLFFNILPPPSLALGIYFVISCIFGYLLLYNLNFIFWISSFWFYVSWSIVTIKDALIVIFAGVVFPPWFMPETMRNIIQITPFDSIFYIPISIYLGRMETSIIWLNILKQIIWILFFYSLGRILWRKALSKLAIQGG